MGILKSLSYKDEGYKSEESSVAVEVDIDISYLRILV